MCGLVGVAGALTVADEAVFTALLIADSVRGTDSTGAAVLSKSGNATIVKALGNPFHLLDTKTYDREVNGLTSSVFLGHNRYATLGAKTEANAHPFRYGHIVGAHNGTLESWSHSALEDLANATYLVDSQAVFAAIARVGIDEVAKEIEGAWALSWIDLDRKKLCFWRNDERPLWYTYYGEIPRLAWASKSGMLGFATDNCGMKMHNNEYHQFEEDVLYEWDLSALATAQKDERVAPVKRELKGKGGTSLVSYGYGSCGQSWEEHLFDKVDEIGKPRKTASTETVVLAGCESDPYAGMVSKSDFCGINHSRCNFCEIPMEYGDQGVVIDLVNDILLCEDCSPSYDTTIFVSPAALAGAEEAQIRLESPFAD